MNDIWDEEYGSALCQYSAGTTVIMKSEYRMHPGVETKSLCKSHNGESII